MMRVTFARLRSHGRVRAEGRVELGRGVRFHLAPGAVVTLEDSCHNGAGTRFHVHGHARIGADVAAVLERHDRARANAAVRT